MAGLIPTELLDAFRRNEVLPERPKKSRRVAAPSWTLTETETREGENGKEYSVDVPYMAVTCARCGNAKTIHGHQQESYDAACVLLRESCPKGESNFYAEP